MVATTRNANCWLGLVILALLLSGCRHITPAAPPAAYPTASWNLPTGPSTLGFANNVPAANGSVAGIGQQPAGSLTNQVQTQQQIVRGQNPPYGGHSVAALPGEPLVGPRYSTTTPGATRGQVRPVQFTQPVPPGAAPAAVSPSYQPAGTGLYVPGNPQPTLPYGGVVQPVAQPPFVPESPLVLPPDRPIDLDVMLEEAQTGRLMFGVGINSDAGLVGNLVIDEQNFDIMRWPRSLGDWTNGTAFRGAGQRFRLEALPGTQVQRYTASFSDPYFLGTNVSFGSSAFYYERDFTDWNERRWGGRLSLGYIFPERPDLSTTFSTRYEQIDIAKPRTPTPPELKEVVGDNELLSFRWEISHDVRDNAFLPSEGHLIRLAFEQGLGTFSYPRFEGDYRKYFVVRQRPDASGRHVLGLSGHLGVSGSDTPIYENFFAGGFSTLRGFEFRGASPKTLGVIVGGEFQILASAEYRFPLTADDNLYGSFFLDAGTVERSVEITDFRVTPGFELRVNIPALGPVPLAVGFGVPITHATGDDIQNFHFFVGLSR